MLKQLGKTYEFHRYDGAGHGFFNDDAPGLPAGAGGRRLEKGIRVLRETSGGIGRCHARPTRRIQCAPTSSRRPQLVGSAKGPNGWMRIDTANVYYDHPYHAPLDHALGIDFINDAEGGRERVAVELSAQSARELVDKILRGLVQR